MPPSDLAPKDSNTLFVGISGVPSSGKSTLSYLLTLIYPNTILLHADDFSESDMSKIPLLPPPPSCPDGDSVYAIDFSHMLRTLDIIKDTARLPADYVGWYQTEIQSLDEGRTKAVTALGGDAALVKLQAQLDKATAHRGQQSLHEQRDLVTLAILDGFLLYHNVAVLAKLDTKLFLRTSKATAAARRLAKPGWGKDATPEKFWATEAYFEASVWKNSVQEHGEMFMDGDVE